MKFSADQSVEFIKQATINNEIMKENVESIEHLAKGEAIKKMKELAEDIRVCFFTTHLDETPLQTRPMTAREVDEEGNIWFFSDEASNKNFEIEDDARVQLFFGHPSKTEFLTVYGHAMVNRDRRKIEDLWHPMAKAWFTDKDDPTLTLIMVIPDHAYYWDTKNNRMISLLKILKSTVSDKTSEDGVEGTLKI